MEVQKHPHHVTHKKKSKEYFLEFLMIFLAVFLGFLAENIREGVADTHREKQYMISMIEDLKEDTVSLSASIRLRQQRKEMLDSLIFLLSPGKAKENGNSIYYYGRFITPPIYFFPNDRTIQQLKSTGSLRLVRNMQVSNSIMAYDRKMRQEIFEYNDEQIVRGEIREVARKVFDGEVFSGMTPSSSIDKPVNNPQLFTSDPALINEFVVEVQYLRKANQNQVLRAGELFSQAKELIDIIKRGYHLDD